MCVGESIAAGVRFSLKKKNRYDGRAKTLAAGGPT